MLLLHKVSILFTSPPITLAHLIERNVNAVLLDRNISRLPKVRVNLVAICEEVIESFSEHSHANFPTNNPVQLISFAVVLVEVLAFAQLLKYRRFTLQLNAVRHITSIMALETIILA
jgi:hypothetical protein